MKLFLECKPDETLARALGVSKADIVHSHGKGRISNYLKKSNRVSAMVDEDKGATETETFRRFTIREQKHGVQYKDNAETKNRLIVICPRLEPWLLETCRAAQINPEDYGLPNKLRDLDGCINHRLPSLTRLVEELVLRQNPRVLWLEQIK